MENRNTDQKRTGRLRELKALSAPRKRLLPLAESKFMPRCDFCNQPSVLWYYPVKDFYHKILEGSPEEMLYLSSWAACRKCSDFIEAGDLNGLSREAIKSHRQIWKTGLDTKEARRLLGKSVRAAHKEFFANRTGPRRPAVLEGG